MTLEDIIKVFRNIAEDMERKFAFGREVWFEDEENRVGLRFDEAIWVQAPTITQGFVFNGNELETVHNFTVNVYKRDELDTDNNDQSEILFDQYNDAVEWVSRVKRYYEEDVDEVANIDSINYEAQYLQTTGLFTGWEITFNFNTVDSAAC